MSSTRIRKSLYLIAILLLCSIFLYGCFGKSVQKSSAEIYLTALNDFDMEKMKEVIEIRQQNQFDEVIGTEFKEGTIEYVLAEFIKTQTSEFEFSIKDTADDSNLAVVEVDYPFIDWGKAYKAIKDDVMNQVLMLILSGSHITDENMYEILSEFLLPENQEPKWGIAANNIEFPVINDTINVILVKENDEWYVRNIKPKMVNSSWLGLKDFADEIGHGVSEMGLSTVNKSTENQEKQVVQDEQLTQLN